MISVSTVPGSTIPTRTRLPISSCRIPSLNALTPNLVSEYTAVPGLATRPPVELIVTTSATPRGESAAAAMRWGSAARVA